MLYNILSHVAVGVFLQYVDALAVLWCAERQTEATGGKSGPKQ